MGTQRRAAALGVAGSSAATALAVWLGRLAAGSWPGWGPVPLDEALGFLVTLTTAAVTTWVGAVLAAATVPLLGPPGGLRADSAGGGGGASGAAPRPETNGPVARVTAALLAAAALGLGPAAAHAAVDTRVGQELVQVGSAEAADTPDGVTVPVPGWTPTEASTPAARSATCGDGARPDLVTSRHEHGAREHRAGDDHVVVHRGDSLWSIAARHLGAQATEMEVAEEWPRWYAANRAVIGDEPDHLLPGQVLVVPTGAGR